MIWTAIGLETVNADIAGWVQIPAWFGPERLDVATDGRFCDGQRPPVRNFLQV